MLLQVPSRSVELILLGVFAFGSAAAGLYVRHILRRIVKLLASRRPDILAALADS
jgi:hypothetical protein